MDRLTKALTQDGDGLSVADLTTECAGIDLDAIAAKDQTINEEVQELRNRLMEARETRNAARQAFEAIGGDDKAARDAADRQAALAEMYRDRRTIRPAALGHRIAAMGDRPLSARKAGAVA